MKRYSQNNLGGAGVGNSRRISQLKNWRYLLGRVIGRTASCGKDYQHYLSK